MNARSMLRVSRWAVIGLALVSALTMATAAWAGQPSGTALLEAVNVRARTVVLLGETYQMTDHTHFVDAAGRKGELALLRPMPKGVRIVSEEDVDVLRWRASQTPRGWVLDELSIVEKMPD